MAKLGPNWLDRHMDGCYNDVVSAHGSGNDMAG